MASDVERLKYHMTDRQGQHLDTSRDASRNGHTASQNGGSREQLRRRSTVKPDVYNFSFWINMVDHELKDDEFKSGIINGLALLGIGTQSGSGKSALNYTPMSLPS